jgi:hypothetical protein
VEEEVGSVPRDQASSIDDVAERAFSYDDDLLIPIISNQKDDEVGTNFRGNITDFYCYIV